MDDTAWKTREWLLERLIRITCRGGNYLLNIGPKPDGTIPVESVTALTEMGDWIKDHAEALYTTDPSPYLADKAVHHDWGDCTTKTNKLYLHVTYWPTNNLVSVPLISNTVSSVKYLFDNAMASLPFSTTTDADGNNMLNITVSDSAPDPVGTILVVNCAGNDVVLHPFKHRYDSGLKKTTLKARNVQLHGEKYQITYDRTKEALLNWTANNGEYDSAVWTIDLSQPGIYNVKLIYSVDAASAGRDIDVKLNDGTLTTFKTISTGSFDTYSTQDIGSVILPDGPQELEIHPKLNGSSPLQLKEVILTFESTVTPPAIGAKISLHQNDNYTGWAAEFVAGDYPSADLIAAGGLNNDVSSVQVPTGYIVQLFKEDHFAGESLLLMADDVDLADNGFNDNISSLRVLLIGSVLYPSASQSASGLTGLDFGLAANSLQLFSSANSQAWLDFTGTASTNDGFVVLVAFKCDAFLTNNWNDVIGNASAISGFGMRYSQTGAIQAYLGGASVDRGAKPVQAGDTVVFAFNYNAGAGSYAFWDSKNGSEVTKFIIASNFSRTAAVTLGRMDSANRYVKGMVGEVKIFRTKLSSTHFQSERDALVAKWITGPQLSGYDVWAATNNIGTANADDDSDGRKNLWNTLLAEIRTRRATSIR